MNARVELYRGPDFESIGPVPLSDVVVRAMEHLLGHRLADATITVKLIPVPDRFTPAGSPTLTNLDPEFGFAYVDVRQAGALIYRHPHPTGELLGPGLRAIAAERDPTVAHWGYRISIDGVTSGAGVRPSPHVAGATAIDPLDADDGPTFTIRPLEESPLPEISLADLGVAEPATAGGAPVGVVLSRAVAHELSYERPLSERVEEGGFLVGHAYRDATVAGGYLVQVTGAPMAMHTGASLLHFTYTGDSFAALKETLRRGGSRDRLLGWFHTHLFPASIPMGLSSIDVTLHFGTFTLPWQVAGLINLGGPRGRTLRFYVRRGEIMVQCRHWVVG
jgi:hypothetical protein